MTLAYRPQQMIDSRVNRAQIVPASDVWDIDVNRNSDIKTNVRTLSLSGGPRRNRGNQKEWWSLLITSDPRWKEHASNALAGAVFGLFLLLGIVVAGEIEGNPHTIPAQSTIGSETLHAGIPQFGDSN